jgi:hypothetical protein
MVSENAPDAFCGDGCRHTACLQLASTFQTVPKEKGTSQTLRHRASQVHQVYGHFGGKSGFRLRLASRRGGNTEPHGQYFGHPIWHRCTNLKESQAKAAQPKNFLTEKEDKT